MVAVHTERAEMSSSDNPEEMYSPPQRRRISSETPYAAPSRPSTGTNSLTRKLQFSTCKNLLDKMVATSTSLLDVELTCADLSTEELHVLIFDAIQKIKDTERQKQNLVSIPKEGDISKDQKGLLKDLIENRKNNIDEDGCIIIPAVGAGKASRYLKIPKAATSSNEVSRCTQNRRSALIESLYTMTAVAADDKKTDGKPDESVKALMVNTIRRSVESYAEAGKEAGLKVIASFKRETILKLKSMMPLKMWRLLKRTFKMEIGRDTFGSEGLLKKEIREMEFAYECGHVTSPSGDIIDFVRVKSMKEVVQRMVSQLGKANQLVYLKNLPADTLWLHVSGDKGGKTTKLILQVINSKDRHSIQNTKLLGIFEGKDSRYNLEQVFGPLFIQLYEVAAAIEELDLMAPCIMDIDEQPEPSLVCNEMIRGHPKYRRCRFSNGGDWEYEARVLGLVGPNAKQFCNHCLIKLEQLAKGEAHALHKLPKYDNTTKDFTLRSVGRCYTKSAQYKAAAARVKSTKTADFESCQSDPLIKGTTDKVIDVVSTTPLHISLGVGLHILNIMEKQAITLDNTIKADMGEYNAFDNLNQQQREIIDKIKELTEDVEVEKEKIRQVEEKANDLRNDRPEFFETTRNGHFKKKTDLAKGVRERVQNYVKEAADLQNKADKLTKQIQKQENQFDKVIKELDSVRGPFKRRFDALLDSMHLQRVAYHSGAIVGPDVHKITRNKNIKNITRIFQPIQLRNKNNVTTTYSSNDIVNKMATLMYKFKACYSLYTANRELCRHEVEILALRCTSFGCWLPTNFPEESMKRKFHVLAVEVPRQARRLQTVGMLTKQTIESLHPYINKLERMFCSTQRKQDKAY